MRSSLKVPNVIVPMAGTGSRFRKAGYDTYKPFILIDDKPMIRHVLDAFPAEAKKFIIYTPSLLNEDELSYLQKSPDIVLCPIEPHKNGPAFSIWKASSLLPLEESFFVSYCDIFWTWDYENVVKPLLNYDGIVFTRKSFHPHLVKDNFSAFCKPKDSDPTLLEKIQEKSSFTEDWMREPLSVGAFYFKHGQSMVDAIDRLINSNTRVANEFFPSLAFNELLNTGAQVKLADVDFFIHWGLPSQLNDYIYWNDIFNRIRNRDIKTTATKAMENICCMGGLGARMKSIGEEPKALLPVEGLPMYEFVAKQMVPSAPVTLLTVPTVIEKIGSGAKSFEIFNIGEQTKSQFQTLLRSREVLQKKNNFILSSCDALGFINFSALKKLTDLENSEAVIFTFKPTLLQAKLAGHHTFVSVDGNRVTEVHIKSRSSDADLGLAGVFWFKQGDVFKQMEMTPEDSKYEMCADHFLKFLVNSGKKVSALSLDAYVHLGTPEEYSEFQFWSHYTAKLSHLRES